MSYEKHPHCTLHLSVLGSVAVASGYNATDGLWQNFDINGRVDCDHAEVFGGKRVQLQICTPPVNDLVEGIRTRHGATGDCCGYLVTKADLVTETVETLRGGTAELSPIHGTIHLRADAFEAMLYQLLEAESKEYSNVSEYNLCGRCLTSN